MLVTLLPLRKLSERQARSLLSQPKANAGSVAGVQNIVQIAMDTFGQIDILIANAGVLPMKGETTWDSWLC